MTEILPQIKEVWEEMANFGQFELISVNVDNFKEINFKELLDCDKVICSAFNLNIVGFLKTFRGQLGVKVPMVFYLHGLATVGLWPLVEFGLWPYLIDQDRFVGTCEGDLNCLKLLDIDHTLLSAFSSSDNLKELPPLRGENIEDLVYIGRLSHQKNLVELIKAFNSLSIDYPHLKLHLYGKEDDLDSPNLGLKRKNYLEDLKNISGDNVLFHGFVSRDEIKSRWRGRSFLFCSPSLHSDENFGMAALMALECGGRALLSDWGGHKNFKRHFPERVETIPIQFKEGEFSLKAEVIKEGIIKSLHPREAPSVSSPFTKEKIARKLFKELEFSGRGLPLPLAPLAEELCCKRREFVEEDPNHQQRVFFSHEDEHLKSFFKAYGA